MNNVQRYEWEDALIEASAVGHISSTELITALRLARVITWKPANGKPSGLYWANELAAAVVGVARATLYKSLKTLKDQGFFGSVKGNLIAAIPKSQSGTSEAFREHQEGSIRDFKESKTKEKSPAETSKSLSETQKSPGDNPYTVDTYTDDSFTVEEPPSAAVEEFLIEEKSSLDTSLDGCGDVPKSLTETFVSDFTKGIWGDDAKLVEPKNYRVLVDTELVAAGQAEIEW